MPQILRIGPYIIYFWSNENAPLEPVHVHIAEGRATANATKIWITSTGKALLCNNNAQIPERILNRLIRVVESNTAEIADLWLEHLESSDTSADRPRPLQPHTHKGVNAMRLPESPLFSDPIYNGAADPVIIWNKFERQW